jgi:hypothetical protein
MHCPGRIPMEVRKLGYNFPILARELRMQYRINAPRIVFEQIENETILIDFDSGAYFSVGPVGSAVIRWLAEGCNAADLVNQTVNAFSQPTEIVERDLDAFLSELKRESILIPAGDSVPATLSVASATSDTNSYEAPILLKYSDMKDLLLLDPIHEVDESGWPKQKDES